MNYSGCHQIIYAATKGHQVRDSILTMAEVAMEHGILLDELAEPYHDYSKDENYRHCSRWIALDVDLSAISDKQQRL